MFFGSSYFQVRDFVGSPSSELESYRKEKWANNKGPQVGGRKPRKQQQPKYRYRPKTALIVAEANPSKLCTKYTQDKPHPPDQKTKTPTSPKKEKKKKRKQESKSSYKAFKLAPSILHF